MPRRIPHTDMEVIAGTQTTQNYLKMQKILGRFYFKDFFSKFDLLHRTGRFLEVGPGGGYQTAIVAERYKPEEIVGLEYSSDMMKVAEGYMNQKGLEKIKFVNGAVENTDLIKDLGRFDLVYSTFSLHHWTDPAVGIRNLYESLYEGGILFIYDFFRGGIFYYMKIKRGIWESIRASYTPEEIDKILRDVNIVHYTISRKNLYMDFVVTKGQ
jgi:ubiquinone/menaquinone biosynthesis C-methylase UbiE